MALGPKAMGEAIAHNLKAKTGRSLDEWLAVLDAAAPADRGASLAWLKSQGLGHFQAQLVVNRRDGLLLYDDAQQLVDELFATHPEQRTLYERIVADAETQHGLTPSPCKGYVPLYSARRRIVVSLKPTDEGLYLGLIGESFPFATVPHRRSLGGSERMTNGVYVHEPEAARLAVASAYEQEARAATAS